MKSERVRWEFLAVLLIPIGIGVAVWATTGAEPEVRLPALTAELLVQSSTDPESHAEAKSLFAASCAACHGSEAQGVVGPNLTDDAWLHGSAPLQIHSSIATGFPDKGMAPFKNLLGERKVRLLAGYLLTLKGKNVKGKPPEGVTGP